MPPHETGNSAVTRSFVGLGLGEGVARVIAFGTTLIIARRAGAEGLGVVSFAFAILLYLQRFVDAGIDLGIGIREAASRKEELGRFVPPVLTLRLAIAGVVLALVAMTFVLLPSLEARMVALYAVSLVPLALGTRWVLISLGATRDVGFARAIGELVVLVAVTLAVVNGAEIWRVPVAQLLGDTVAVTLLLLALRRLGVHIRLRWDTGTIRPLVRHVAPYVGSALLGLAIFNSDLIFLRAFTDRTIVGLYASAYALISFLINVGATYALSLIPSLTRTANDPSRQQELYDTSWARAVAVLAPVTVGGIMIAADALTLVFGTEFSPAGTVLAVLMLSVPLSILRSLSTSSLIARGREDLVLRTVIIAASVNVALNVIAVPMFGMMGAAIATVATELLRLIITQRSASQLGTPPPQARRYAKALFAAAVMAGVLALGPARIPLLAILLGGVVYGVALRAMGGIGRDAEGRLQLQV